jgi:hypothetical protein
VDVGHRDGQVEGVHRALAGGGQIGVGHATPHHQAGRQAHAGDLADGLDLHRPHGRNADLHLLDTDIGEGLGDGTFLLDGEGHASGLFAVAQGGVVDGRQRVHGRWCPFTT